MSDETALILQISIHALCEEGDTVDGAAVNMVVISIHALCEEGDVAITE